MVATVFVFSQELAHFIGFHFTELVVISNMLGWLQANRTVDDELHVLKNEVSVLLLFNITTFS